MPYLKRTSGQTQEQSGVLGQGAVPTGRQATAAGHPGSFTNIQNYLSANQGTPRIQNQLENKAQSDIKGAANEIQGQISGLKPLPEANPYSQQGLQDALKTDNYDVIKQGAYQTYQPQDVTKELPGSEKGKELQNLQKGSFKSLMDYFGGTTRPSAQYTQGQQKLDELLLRGNPSYVNNAATRLQDQYKTQVTNPTEEARNKRQEQEQASSSSINKAAQDWKSGINSFLSGQDQAIQNELARETQDYNSRLQQINSLTPIQRYENFFGTDSYDKLRGGLLPYLNPATNPSANQILSNAVSNAFPTDYGSGVSQYSAVQGALGNKGIEQYNKLNEILNTGKPGILGGRSYNFPTIGSFNLNALAEGVGVSPEIINAILSGTQPVENRYGQQVIIPQPINDNIGIPTELI